MKQEKVLARKLVKELGLDKLEVITSDMIEGYTSIGDYVFYRCDSITSVTIPNSITSIGERSFAYCFFTHLHHDTKFCNKHWIWCVRCV